MHASRGLRAAVLLVLALALPSTMGQRAPPPPPGGGGAAPVPRPPPPGAVAARPPPPTPVITNTGARTPPPPGAANPTAPTPGQVPNPTPGTTGGTTFPGKTSFPTSPFAPLNNPALICVAQDLIHPVNGLPLGIVLDANNQPTWNAVGGNPDERKLMVVDMPASPFVILPFQDKYQTLAIKQPAANAPEICRPDGSGHCSRAYEFTISDEKLQPFNRVVPRCTQGNFIAARCTPTPLVPPATIPPPPTCVRIDIPTYTGTWFLTYDKMSPGPMMRVPVGHEVMLRFNNRICTNELAGVVDPLAPAPAIAPVTDPVCVAQAASPKGVFFGNGPPVPVDVLAGIAAVVPPLCETRLDPFGLPNPGRGRGTVVHHHGSASIAPFDGWAEDMTCWGESKDYMYPINRPTTAWYHDHSLHTTHWNALFGLQGMFIHSAKQVDGGCGEPWNLDNIPDLPMVLGDKLLNQECQQYKPLEAEYMFFGDINMVNGVAFPVMDLEPKTYRFRFLDASVSRPWIIKLKSGTTTTLTDRGPTLCKVIAGDGGFRQTPVAFPLEGILMGVAERYEVVCDFSGVAGQTLYWYNDRDLVTFDSGGLLHNQVPYFCWSHLIAQIRVGPRTAATTAAPRLNLLLGPAQGIIPIKDVISQTDYDAAMTMANNGQFHRSFEFSKVVDFWTINGRTWDTARVAANDVGQNTWEVWKLLSGGTWFHPVHIHLIDAYILKRFTFRGATIRSFEQLTPKDMIFLGPTNQVYVLIRFGAHKGEYMFHCHNMVHEDADMMRSFQVLDPALSLTKSAKPSQEATASKFIVNPIQNVVYGTWQWFDPTDGLSCMDPQSATHPLCDPQAQARQTGPTRLDATLTPPALDVAHQTHFDRSYYRIFYPSKQDIIDYGGASGITNPWQAPVCAFKPAVANPTCNHAQPC